MRLTSVSLEEASSNGDGTYDDIKAMQWMYESLTGKILTDEEAQKALDEAMSRRHQNTVSYDYKVTSEDQPE